MCWVRRCLLVVKHFRWTVLCTLFTLLVATGRFGPSKNNAVAGVVAADGRVVLLDHTQQIHEHLGCGVTETIM